MQADHLNLLILWSYTHGHSRRVLEAAKAYAAEGAGFDHDTNVVTLFARDGRDLALPRMSKSEVAQRILDEVVRLRCKLRSEQRSSV